MSITTVSNYLTSATSNNTNNTIVARDASGNFSAGIVTATSIVVGSGVTINTSGINVTGTVTATSIVVGSGVTINTSGINVTGIVTATSIVGNGTIPVGGIIMWSGTIANIPTPGWALCDGSNSTPDLRNKFIVGAHGGAGIGTISTAGPEISTDTATNPNYTPGNIGGETAHKLTIAELASHTHPLTNQISGGGSSTGSGGSGTIDTATGSAGSSNYHENRPPYYALAFIMRTS